MIRSNAANAFLQAKQQAAHRAMTIKQGAGMIMLALVVQLLHATWPIAEHSVFLTPWMLTIDFSNAVANAALNALYDTNFPASSNLLLRTGALAGAESADTGTVVATIVLPASPWAAAAAGSKAKSGTWQDASADAAGTAAHYRLTGTTTTMIEEGTVTATGGGGDMTLDNTVLAVGQLVTITSFTRTL